VTQGYGEGLPPPPPQGAAGAVPGWGEERPGRFMGHDLAGWLHRVVAYLIDVVIAFIPPFAAGVVLDPGPGQTMSGTTSFVYLLLWMLGPAVWVYNRWILQGRSGQSWGKQVMNTRLVRADDGLVVGGAVALLRDLAHLLDALPCILFPIGFLWPIWDSRRQTFADKIMNTVVVMRRRPASAP
jgi:uncharacterized RDD family membrane protein YckC